MAQHDSAATASEGPAVIDEALAKDSPGLAVGMLWLTGNATAEVHGTAAGVALLQRYRERVSEFDDEREEVVYEMAVCLSESRWVSKGLYDRALKALGHVGITDVICLMGFYSSVSMTLAFYDVPAGAEGLQR